VAEEAGRAESAQQSRERQGLREFGMKSETTRGGLLFICSKISTAAANSFGIWTKAVLI
jgi:hypothetical protein